MFFLYCFLLLCLVLESSFGVSQCSHIAILIISLPFPLHTRFLPRLQLTSEVVNFVIRKMSAVCQAKQFWQTNKIIYNCQTIQTISISIYAWPDISGKYAGQNVAAAAAGASTMPIKYAHNNGAACSCCLCCYCYCCNSFWPKTKGQSNECPKLLNFYLKRTTQRGKKNVCACMWGRGSVGVAGYNARAGLQLPTATNHFDRVQSIQMPRAARYAKAKLFFLPRQSSTNNTRHMYTLYTHAQWC